MEDANDVSPEADPASDAELVPPESFGSASSYDASCLVSSSISFWDEAYSLTMDGNNLAATAW